MTSKNNNNIQAGKKPAKKTTKSKTNSDNKKFPIVGIGASAGGLEALEQFFANTPSNAGIAYVVVQHLDPNHIGIMDELLQRVTPMKVIQITDGLKIVPDCVYVIPPNKSVSILNGVLHLFKPVEKHGLRLPINTFFRSLAEDQKDNSVGIILTGMGSDGSLGLKSIKESNGIVVVQSPDTAKFDSMPINATNAVIADIIAPVDELPAKLISFLKYIPDAKTRTEIDSNYNINHDKIIILIREQIGHDFSNYKKNTLYRRIERRKGVHQFENIKKYVDFLQENPNEIEILFKELLIGVTSFFRDHDVWEKLKEETLPALIKKLPKGYVLRAWVTGCSTGEEAYTLAIIFKEVVAKLKRNDDITLQVFATDLDADAIEIARKGIFTSAIISDVSSQRIKRFFIREGSGYRLNAAIREMVVFATQNLIKDPPFTKLDILTCRNLMIYLEPDLQRKLLSLFNYSLISGGIMILGTAETLGSNREEFKTLDSKLKIFKRTTKGEFAELLDFPSAFTRLKPKASEYKITPKKIENVQTVAEQIMLQHYAPASVMVNQRGDILFITGRTGKYLEPAAGKTNINIHAMAREGLRELLPGVFRKANLSYDPVLLRKIKIGNNGGNQLVDVTVQRIETPNSVRDLLIVVFSDVGEILDNDVIISKTGKQFPDNTQKDLEGELAQSYQDIQELREEMQTSQEELKSTNEELQSTNEELQSTNEELTTSKEEMQSLNEELQTVNSELQSKVNDSIRTNNDIKNLLNSTEIATLFLDKEFKIRRFTDSLINIFKLRQADVGRPFTDLVNDLNYPEILQHCEQVLKNLAIIETEITSSDNRWFIVRIIPYRKRRSY